ncbi:MAG: Uma2 family endonuclease [Planctomycetia bacterium]|nr:Uma2 family endonuclease [Planctomycetia bacterium]
MSTGTRPRGRDRWLVVDTDWSGYTRLLKALGDRGVPRPTYLDGRVTLVSPGYTHELLKKRLAALVEDVLVGLGIDYVASGQTTLRRRPRGGGVEGDETYYIANADRVADKTGIDLRVDPPPDLAVEVVVSHPVKDALEVYRRLRVPEVWVCDGQSLRILKFGDDNRYAEAGASAALPFLTADEILGWVQRPESGKGSRWRLEIRRWVAETLAARQLPRRADSGRQSQAFSPREAPCETTRLPGRGRPRRGRLLGGRPGRWCGARPRARTAGRRS